MPSSNPLKKMHKSLPKKRYGLKTFAQSKNSQKFRFSVTFLLITYFALLFYSYLTYSKSASKSTFVDTHIEFLLKKCSSPFPLNPKNLAQLKTRLSLDF